MSKAQILALAALCSGCPRADLLGLTFECAVDGDCPPGQRCDGQRCGPPGDPDAGRVDAGSEPEMGCVEGTGSWWCYGATAAEVEAYAIAKRAYVADLEVEPGERLRYAAVFLPQDGLPREQAYDISWDRIETEHSMRWKQPADIEPFGASFAAVFRSTTDTCGAWRMNRVPASTAEEIRSAFDLPVVSVQRYGDPPLALVVALPRATPTTISLGLPGGEIDLRLTDGTESLLSFEHAGATDLYDVVFGAQEGPPSTWVHDVSAGELEARAAELGAHVTRIDVWRENERRRFAALLVENAHVPDRRASESRRLAAMLAMGARNATVALYRKEHLGGAEIFYRERRPFLARNMIGPQIAAHIIELWRHTAPDPPELDIEDAIPLPSIPCGTSTTSTRTITIGNAMKRMLADRNAQSATALVHRIGGLLAVEQHAHARGLRDTIVRTPPGCDTLELASQTTLVDQAEIFEVSRYCFTLGNEAMRNRMPGRIGDPDGVRAILEEMITEALVGSSTTALAVFLMEAEVMYTASALDGPGVVRRALAGRVKIPFCTGQDVDSLWDFRAHSFGLYLEGEGDEATAEAAIASVMAELMREPLTRGIAAGLICYE